MGIILAIGLLHVMGGAVWAASVIVVALILFSARRDAAAARRALPEVALLSRRVLRPAILVTTSSGLVLAAAWGLFAEAWVVLSTLFAIAALVLGEVVVAPACARVAALPAGGVPEQGRRALRLAALALVGQGTAIALQVLAPGWGGAAILAGLAACLVMAMALLGEAELGEPRPA